MMKIEVFVGRDLAEPILACGRLFGTSQVLQERMGTPLPPYLQEEYTSYEARLRKDLTQDELERLWEQGRVMTVEEAVSYALSV